MPSPSAQGWANGESGCNSYGTHDWVLKKAIKAAGDGAGWVRVRVALRATEGEVDEHMPNYPFRYDGRDEARAGPTTRRVARQAHRYYWDLVNAYDARGYNAKVHRITKRQLKRAANAMADLITSL